ncbi:hypothetical protein IFR08_03575 [Pseudomonas fluorescens]|uniref:hypothetical protein n=1 Tax=Pseudomonas fluorescens TaxID=294 RepID=UPI00178407F4|nr:hypothetical protein [Pseudomonas fluorescens]MBD8095647.1 hypothetical protein [Pseudomonas fluorescens]MBD8772859.1 hypothetical protein [Pseudomonas fluorescens]MBD8778544.1 hypothetical protein [Pseudomonas fluorescens]MBD8795434.1 hypothetical protein [Pseudomonas fluorescens]
MSYPEQENSRQAVRKVVGLVLIIPLLLPLTPIPFGLRPMAVAATLAGSVYGAWYSMRHTSRGVAFSAIMLALLNLGAWVAMSVPSIIWLIFYVAVAYGSGHWIHWRF